MRIGFLSFEYPPGISGGIGSYIYLAARALAQSGHEITVICGKFPGQSLIEEEYPGVRVVRLEWQPDGKYLNLGPTMGNLQKIAETVRQLHRDRNFNIIEGPDYQFEAYRLLKDGFDCPIVTKLHSTNDLVAEITSRIVRYLPRRFLAHCLTIYPRRRLARLVLERSTRLHAPSQAIARVTAKRYDIDSQKIDHVPNLVIPAVSPTSAQKRDSFTVLFVGRLEPLKGAQLFAKIIPKVIAQVPKARFVFLGRDGAYGKHLSMQRWLIDQLGPAAPNCEFMGRVSHSQVQDYMRQAAVCVFPSFWESFPYVCLEAMTAGAAVVGSMRGGMAEMIEDGVSGFLGNPEEPVTFAEKIILALGDEKLRKSLGQAARQRVFERYRPEVIIPQQIAAYQKAIEQYYHSH